MTSNIVFFFIIKTINVEILIFFINFCIYLIMLAAAPMKYYIILLSNVLTTTIFMKKSTIQFITNRKNVQNFMIAILGCFVFKVMLMTFSIFKMDNFSDSIFAFLKQSFVSKKVIFYLRQTTMSVKLVYSFIIKPIEEDKQYNNIVIFHARKHNATGINVNSLIIRQNSSITPVDTRANFANFIRTKLETAVIKIFAPSLILNLK